MTGWRSELVFVSLAALGIGVAHAAGQVSPGCDAGIIESVAAAAQASRVDGGLSSCRRDPVTADQLIVALVSPSDVLGQSVRCDGEERFDLDVVLWDQRAQVVVAHRHDARYLLSDASSLRSSSIDTGRYVLAPGVRAFGVRDSHYPYNTHSKWRETHLTLFVPHGDRIERIFATQVELLTDGDSTTGCPDATRAIRTTVGTAPSRSHGYADLSVVTRDVIESGASGRVCGSPGKVERNQTSYDGATYAPVAIQMYLQPFD